jgi:hypothetical protein
MIAYEKKSSSLLASDNDLLVDLKFCGLAISLLTEFTERSVRPYFKGNMTVAIQDLINKAIAGQEFVLSQIMHVRNCVET